MFKLDLVVWIGEDQPWESFKAYERRHPSSPLSVSSVKNLGESLLLNIASADPTTHT